MTEINFWLTKNNVVLAEFPLEYDPLEAAIQKWEFIVDHPETYGSGGMLSCGLCRYFYLEEGECTNCPVVSSGKGDLGCRQTPYIDWENRDVGDPEKQDFAEAELEFLKSLRKDYNG